MQHPPSATVSPEAAVQPTAWALERLRPPTRVELLLAHRAGRDPNALLERFTEQYLAACARDAATINAIIGDKDDVSPQYIALWDHLNAHAEAHRDEWWDAPLRMVARLLAGPRAGRELADKARRSLYVGFIVKRTTPIGSRQPKCARCPRSEHRPAARRTSSSSRTSSADPGESESDLPAVAEVRLTGRAHEVFVATRCELQDGVVTAEGQWRRRTGANYQDLQFSAPRRYSWPASHCTIRWTTGVPA